MFGTPRTYFEHTQEFGPGYEKRTTWRDQWLGYASFLASPSRSDLGNERLAHSDTSTKPIITGTSMSGPMTAAKAAPLSIPNVTTATAIASSKLLEAAVKESVAHCG